MSVVHVTESAEFQKLISTGVALVDFSASWCGPCKRVEPVFKDLAKENPSVKFIHIDVDDASDSMPNELADVSGVPHFELFHNGTKISQFAGANLNKIRESVKLLKTKLEPPQEEIAKEEPAKVETPKEEPAKEETPKQEPVKEKSADQESKTNENKTESTSEEQNAQQKSE